MKGKIAVFVAVGAGAAGLGLSLVPAGRPPSILVRASAGAVPFGPRKTFLVPSGTLPLERKPDFFAGLALARQPWVRAPSSTDARDGLGPLYNARSCMACHERGGRGVVPPSDGGLGVATLVRLGRRDGDRWQGDPRYGGQLQPRSIDAAHALGGADVELPGEANPRVRWRPEVVRYLDGAQVELRRPVVTLEAPAYGPLAAGTELGLRHAPPLYGLGLLDRVPAEVIAAGADPEDRDRDGISGRAARVWDVARGGWALGRYGLKASQPNLRQQIAAAFVNDVGITSALFPDEACTAAQPACAAARSGAGPEGVEIPDPLLDLVTDFNANLAVPAPRKPEHPLVRAGAARFEAFGCGGCHTPSLGEGVWAYTDLLLHDMGRGLAEALAEGDAEGAEWRTPPLWGVGLARAVHTQAGLLHDGRARTVEEAILWHGGEAEPSRRRFTEAPVEARLALLAFVRSI